MQDAMSAAFRTNPAFGNNETSQNEFPSHRIIDRHARDPIFSCTLCSSTPSPIGAAIDIYQFNWSRIDIDTRSRYMADIRVNGVPVEVDFEAADENTSEIFPVLFDALMREAKAGVYLFAFSFGSRTSFERLIHDHRRIARLTIDRHCPMGTVSLREDDDKSLIAVRIVPNEEGQMLAKTISSKYYELSPEGPSFPTKSSHESGEDVRTKWRIQES